MFGESGEFLGRYEPTDEEWGEMLQEWMSDTEDDAYIAWQVKRRNTAPSHPLPRSLWAEATDALCGPLTSLYLRRLTEMTASLCTAGTKQDGLPLAPTRLQHTVLPGAVRSLFRAICRRCQPQHHRDVVHWTGARRGGQLIRHVRHRVPTL